jgi:hypothetical protein
LGPSTVIEYRQYQSMKTKRDKHVCSDVDCYVSLPGNDRGGEREQFAVQCKSALWSEDAGRYSVNLTHYSDRNFHSPYLTTSKFDCFFISLSGGPDDNKGIIILTKQEAYRLFRLVDPAEPPFVAERIITIGLGFLAFGQERQYTTYKDLFEPASFTVTFDDIDAQTITQRLLRSCRDQRIPRLVPVLRQYFVDLPNYRLHAARKLEMCGQFFSISEAATMTGFSEKNTS